MLAIRPAHTGDAASLAAFASLTFFDTFGHLYPQADKDAFARERFTLERTVQDICERGRLIELAFDAGRLVGFADVGWLGLPVAEPEAGARELNRLYVAGNQKGRGLAQTLMQRVLDRVRDDGAPALYLGVYCDNARAQAFYRKYGFEIVGAYTFKVGATLDDERIMRLGLKRG